MVEVAKKRGHDLLDGGEVLERTIRYDLRGARVSVADCAVTEATRSRMIWDADAVEVAQGISQGAMFGMDAESERLLSIPYFKGT